MRKCPCGQTDILEAFQNCGRRQRQAKKKTPQDQLGANGPEKTSQCLCRTATPLFGIYMGVSDSVQGENPGLVFMLTKLRLPFHNTSEILIRIISFSVAFMVKLYRSVLRLITTSPS